MKSERIPLWTCFPIFLFLSVLTTAAWAAIGEVALNQSTDILTYPTDAIFFLCNKEFFSLDYEAIGMYMQGRTNRLL